jgi:hypothetical protein
MAKAITHLASEERVMFKTVEQIITGITFRNKFGNSGGNLP